MIFCGSVFGEENMEEVLSMVVSLVKFLIDEGYVVGVSICDGGFWLEVGLRVLF